VSKILDFLLANLGPGLTPWGNVYPPRNLLPIYLPVQDGRTYALEALQAYVAELTFVRPGPTPGSRIPFTIPPERFWIEWPEQVQEMLEPTIAVVHSRGKFLDIGLVNYVEEATADVYLPGTVVQWMSEYRETINLEVWTQEKSQRRAVLAGLETAFSPAEEMTGIRFVLHNYFGQIATFTLNAREVIDDRDSALRRRRAQVELEMRFNVVRLIDKQTLQPVSQTAVNADEWNVPIDLSSDPDATYVGPGFP
jgi:hypothetical protein